jgi:nucleotide sugar dehydrogenase
MKLGLIGVGIVGNAFYEGMKHAFDIVRYDKNRTDLSDVTSVASVVEATDGPIFICVPTPMNPDGSCNTGIVEEVVQIGVPKGSNRIIVIKSTVPPGTTDFLQKKLKGFNLSFVFNPEFLTEANPVQDFKNQDRIFIGGSPEATQIVADIYSIAYPGVLQIQSNATTAEMVKYVGNCFLATKVSFANEIYQICEKLGIDYNAVISMATLDKRLGPGHWKVPGPDGHFGFGLTCFPKDINALIAVAKSCGVTPTMLQAAWDKNLEVRPEKDWEQMKGRAVL